MDDEKMSLADGNKNQPWLEEVLNRLPIGLVMVEPGSANYKFVNNAARALLGQSPKKARPELGPQTLIVRDANEKILSVDETPSARASRGEELVNQVIILEKGNDRRYVSCNSNTIPAMAGHPETVLVPFLDISDLKATEIELKDAVKARDEFLSLASHELKTPITALKLQAQMFQRSVDRGDDDAYSKQRVDRLSEQTIKALSRLERLIDEMLDISRIRTGKLTLQKEKVDLVQLTKDLLKRMEYQFIEANVSPPQLSFKKSPCGFWDPLRIEQVLTNLLTNALRYGNGGRVEVGIDERERTAHFWVKDHGIGISIEDQKKIFEKYERVRNASEVSGLGLGLFIAHQIVKSHGGQFFLESEMGRGSTFSVSLPLTSPL